MKVSTSMKIRGLLRKVGYVQLSRDNQLQQVLLHSLSDPGESLQIVWLSATPPIPLGAFDPYNLSGAPCRTVFTAFLITMLGAGPDRRAGPVRAEVRPLM